MKVPVDLKQVLVDKLSQTMFIYLFYLFIYLIYPKTGRAQGKRGRAEAPITGSPREL